MDQSQLQKIINASDEDTADRILQLKKYSQMSQAVEFIILHNPNRWHSIASLLKDLLVIKQEHIYVHHNYLSLDRLMFIRDLFKKQAVIDQIFFKQNSVYVLLAVTEGYLLQNLQNESLTKLKQFVGKYLKKQSHFWGLGELQNIQTYIVDKIGYFTIFNQAQHDQQLDRISYFYSFYENYAEIFSQLIDISSIFFKMMLCLRPQKERDRLLFNKIKDLYFRSRYHFHTTMRNMKFALQFFRNSFNQKQCIYFPQKSLLSILSNYSAEQIEDMLAGTAIGMAWNQRQVYEYFMNCINKLGVNLPTCKLLIAMIKFCQKCGRFSELLYSYQNTISKLFVFMKHENLFTNCLQIMKYFIYSPPPTLSLYQRFIQKARNFADIVSLDQKYLFLNLLQIVAFSYKETTLTVQLTEVIDKHLGQNINRLTEQQMKRELSEYSWKTCKEKLGKLSKKTLKYKGLLNIGNSCYMNSFMQSLFMNNQFMRGIITVSTLELSKQKMKQKTMQGQNSEFISKKIRQDLKPLLQIQKLFALLLRSRRSEISPAIIKNVSPEMFRNTHQQDAIQFGRMFLDLLYNNKIPHLFEGEIITSISCQGCGKSRQIKQIFLDYIISPEQNQQDLQQLIKLSFKQEVHNDLTCDFCHEKRQNSIKRHRISAFPKYLIITIKRFQYDIKEKKNSKIMSKIFIKPNIWIDEVNYQLYSIIIHRGPSPNAGHYFTFSRIGYEEEAKWVCHDDSVVTQHQSFKQVWTILDNNESDTPYILFYYRKDYIQGIKPQLLQAVVLRPPQEQYVQKQDAQAEKSNKKVKLPLFNLFNMIPFKKDDDDQDPYNNQGNFYNSYIS